MGGLAHEHPGAAQNEQRHQHGQERIDWGPARHDDDHGGNHGSQGSQQITQHMQQGATHIEVFAVSAVQDGEGNQVHHESRSRHRQHQPAEDFYRFANPLHGFDGDPGDNGD